MARWANGWRHLAAAALLGGVGIVGCGKKEAAPESAASNRDGGTNAVAAQNNTPADQNPSPAAPLPPPPNDEQHVPFAKAVHNADDPPPNASIPPDTTMTGKAVGKLYMDVTKIWDSIRFVNPQGQKIGYSATIETDLGTIEIALRPDIAPNHVRNFIALAKVGYYDGLCFDRVRSEKAEDDAGKVLDSVEAGCPLGTGETVSGSIGYWLYPEIAKPEAGVTHEEGTVGACRGPDLDTAGCRFYITLTPAPALDGQYTVFGKVTRGLDVARAVWKQPHIEDDQADDDGSHRPVKSVVLRKVTIHEHFAGPSTTTAQNVQ
jgi:cyclophilin family peptidyl-prolyl cis-trans isomerase